MIQTDEIVLRSPDILNHMGKVLFKLEEMEHNLLQENISQH